MHCLIVSSSSSGSSSNNNNWYSIPQATQLKSNISAIWIISFETGESNCFANTLRQKKKAEKSTIVLELTDASTHLRSVWITFLANSYCTLFEASSTIIIHTLQTRAYFLHAWGVSTIARYNFFFPDYGDERRDIAHCFILMNAQPFSWTFSQKQFLA